eukprot:scaffold125486_cov33-Cyclotella_meneghiniana.AAC.1
METQQTSERPLKKRQTSPQSLYQYSKRLASKGPLRKRPLRKQVTFSKYSEQLVFRTRSSFRERNCYSKSEVQLMKAKVMEEVCRIYDLACTRFPQQQTGTAIQSMLQLGLIRYEEIIGIEHLMTPELVEDHVNGRRSHRAVVARTQDLLRKRAVSNEVAMIKLAKVTSKLSSRQVKKAVCRAEMSLHADLCAEPQLGSNGGVNAASTMINSRAAIAKSVRKVAASKFVARAA